MNLDLTAKQKKFCEHYAASGNATDAARKAGYRKPSPQGSENLRKPAIVSYIEQLTASQDAARVATAKERQEFWTRIMRGEDCEFESKDRLKASELLGKAHGDFIDKVHQSGTVKIEVVRECQPISD